LPATRLVEALAVDQAIADNYPTGVAPDQAIADNYPTGVAPFDAERLQALASSRQSPREES
jgi:hypothetical protein